MGREGRILQLDGHLDHIPREHAPPVRTETEIVARGACDMKAGLAALTEAAQVLAEHGSSLPGGLLLTVHGLHEAPPGLQPARLRPHLQRAGGRGGDCGRRGLPSGARGRLVAARGQAASRRVSSLRPGPGRGQPGAQQVRSHVSQSCRRFETPAGIHRQPLVVTLQ
ncbi:MAG TPA: M20/M25/M40 family metallo-hydrolase [Armatimonadetes bacterium]|nr:M20/M25/M40 family metallo-hydrolase [Armatimonadota bacterium]